MIRSVERLYRQERKRERTQARAEIEAQIHDLCCPDVIDIQVIDDDFYQDHEDVPSYPVHVDINVREFNIDKARPPTWYVSAFWVSPQDGEGANKYLHPDKTWRNYTHHYATQAEAIRAKFGCRKPNVLFSQRELQERADLRDIYESWMDDDLAYDDDYHPYDPYKDEELLFDSSCYDDFDYAY